MGFRQGKDRQGSGLTGECSGFDGFGAANEI